MIYVSYSCCVYLYVMLVFQKSEEDPYEDKYGSLVDMSVVKKKSFPMPPIAVDEAVMCLDYIDHDCEHCKGRTN